MDHRFDPFKSAASGVTEALINRLTAGVGTAWARLGSDWRPRVASLAEAEALITRLRDQYNRGVDAEALLARWRHAPSNFVVFGPRGVSRKRGASSTCSATRPSRRCTRRATCPETQTQS